MPRSLKLYITLLVALSAIALVATSFVFGVRPEIQIELDPSDGVSKLEILLGIVFWTGVTILASALPVRMPKGLMVTVSIAPVIAATALGGPATGGWIALIGSTEVREIRGRVPWYGTLANHAGIVIPAIVGGIVVEAIRGESTSVARDFVATISCAAVYFGLNLIIVSLLLHLRTRHRLSELLLGDVRAIWGNVFALAPLGWLMARM